VVLEKQCSQEVRNIVSLLIAFHGNINVISIFVLKLSVNARNLSLCSIPVETHEGNYEQNLKRCGTFEGMLKQNAI
jgi:hypothetical protein